MALSSGLAVTLPPAKLISAELETAAEGGAAVHCLPAGEACIYPGAANTGVPDGLRLTISEGTLHVTTDHAVVEALEILGNVIIDADNVTLRNSRILATSGYDAIRVVEGKTGFTLVDSELSGNGEVQNGILGSGTFLRNNIHGFENGINTWGPSLIQDNYIHGMAGGPDAHFDGIEINRGADTTIRHNTVVNEKDQTSAIMLDNWAGSLARITVDKNLLIGGGCTIYLDDRFSGGTVEDNSIKITRNLIGAGVWGPFALYNNKPVLYANIELDKTTISKLVKAARN